MSQRTTNTAPKGVLVPTRLICSPPAGITTLLPKLWGRVLKSFKESIPHAAWALHDMPCAAPHVLARIIAACLRSSVFSLVTRVFANSTSGLVLSFSFACTEIRLHGETSGLETPHAYSVHLVLREASSDAPRGFTLIILNHVPKYRGPLLSSPGGRPMSNRKHTAWTWKCPTE